MWKSQIDQFLIQFITMIIISIGSYFFHYNSSKNLDSNQIKTLLPQKPMTAQKTMFLWRIQQLLFRNRLTQICVGLSVLFMALTFYASLSQAPLFVLILSNFIGGLLIASAMAFQLSADLEYSWVEKNLGISHEEYLKALLTTSTTIGFVGMLLSLGILSIIELNTIMEQPIYIHKLLKVSIMFLLPAYFFPYLAFQIDGKKPLIQIILSLLIGLFICTAIFAHWLGLILIPLFVYYGNQTQQNHFYRA